MTAGRRTLLVVTDRRFWRRSIGSEQRVANLVEHLARRSAMRVVVAYLGRPSGDEREAIERFGESLPSLEIRGRSSAPVSRLADALGSALDGLRRGRGSARRRFVQRLLRELEPDAVLVEFLRLTSTVHPRPAEPGPRPPAYYVDTHDVLHERAARFRAHGARPDHAVDAEQEARALATYDAILAIQTRDAATFRALVPARPVVVVPHGLALPDPAPGLEAGPRPLRLGFLGGRDASNRAALDWFLAEVWPMLAARFPDRVELRVAGSLAAAEPSREKPGAGGERVVFLGPVASIGAFWPTIDVAINPIRFGSGLKIKNVEALAWRRALLTTPIGAEGLEAAAPDGLAIAGTPAEWLAILGHWIEDRDAMMRIAEAGRRFAEAQFTPTLAFRGLDALLDELLDASPGRRAP